MRWIWVIGESTLNLSMSIFVLAQIFMAHTLYKSTRSLIAIGLIWMVYYSVIYSLLNLTDVQDGVILLIIIIAGLMAHLIIFPKIPVIQNCFTFFFTMNTTYACFMMARAITALFGGLLDQERADMLFTNTYLVITSFFLITFYVETKFAIWTALSVYKHRLINLLIFSMLLWATAVTGTEAISPWLLPDFFGKVLKSAFFVAIIASGYLLAFSALVNLGKQLQSEAENKISKEQLISSSQYYGTLVENIKNVRMNNHNMKYIVSAVAGLAERGDIEELRKFIHEVERELPKNFPIWSRVPEIDAIFATAADTCSKEGIVFTCEYTLPHNNGIEALHMCIILGNAMRNATEACQKMDETQQRFVAVQCFPIMDKIVICVENSFDGKLNVRPDGTLGTMKDFAELHGYGIESIQNTAEKYHGNCTWESTLRDDGQNVFKLNILLTRPEQKDALLIND